MSTYIDKDVEKLIINKLTRAQYNSLVAQGLINEDELYFITDDAESEIVTNKVTSLSSSSTDTQYPSAKAVYDALQNKQDTLTAGNGISITTESGVTTISVSYADGDNLTY